ncbi:hypothetical protein BE221DRAFT_87495 [Ostreococcus tauri]|uniref:Alpha-ketoglutarate-dependent dioxygenase AlkB-like domain-containing protein n=1 Tax=Ostreococcus tauri TaxID=70448 RepID=A0A1Y5IQK1_OSTTA|nr:hypothetical protein BE221DRAFT_87495 [Ostreococcus tauri]
MSHARRGVDASSTRGKKRPRARGNAASGTSTASALVECPLCGRSIARAIANAHASECEGEGSLKGCGRLASSEKRREVVDDFRGRRAHTGARTTGWVAKDDLAGGWIDRRDGGGATVGKSTPVDAEGTKDAFAEMARAMKRVGAVKMSGHFLLLDFITEDEERAIVEYLDADTSRPWKDSSFNGAHEGKKYGVEPNLLKRTVEPTKVPIPKILKQLVIKKFASAHETLRRFEPNECNAINYRKDLGSVLTPHCDDRQLSSDILVNLSLVSDCTMTYIHEKHPERRVEVYLPRRSLQIQSGSTRYDYMHSIANENLHGDRRVSVTFRESGAFTAKKK